jgi:hypothetical protein
MTSIPTVLALLVVTSLPLGHSMEKRSADPQSTRAVSDTLDCLGSSSDSVAVIVKMKVRSQDPDRDLPPEFERLLIEKFRAYLEPAPGYAAPILTGSAPCDAANHRCVGAMFTIGATAKATARPDGQLTDTTVIDFGLSTVFSDSIRSVIRQLNQQKAWPYARGVDTIPLAISFSSDENPDSVPVFRHLFLARVPRFAYRFTDAAWPEFQKGPKYPRLAVEKQVSDSVEVQYTVLSDGSIPPQSIDVVAAYYPDFAKVVLERLATLRYVPARAGLCTVPTRVAKSFVFPVP